MSSGKDRVETLSLAELVGMLENPDPSNLLFSSLEIRVAQKLQQQGLSKEDADLVSAAQIRSVCDLLADVGVHVDLMDPLYDETYNNGTAAHQAVLSAERVFNEALIESGPEAAASTLGALMPRPDSTLDSLGL